MRKNLMDKIMNSHNKDKHSQSQSGVWLYAGHEVAGYLTADGELLDLRPEGDTI